MSRSSRPWLAYAVAAALLLAGAYLCFELGRYQAGYSIIDHRRVISALDEQIAKQRATADDLHRQIAIFETSRRIDQETYSQIQANLADLQARIRRR